MVGENIFCSIIGLMKQKGINFVKLLKNYKSGWVGISTDHSKVLFWGKTLKSVMQKAQQAKEKVFFFPIEKSYDNFIGSL